MALSRVNAVVVGAGAGGGIVAKELSEAGLTVVLLERGKWFRAWDCRKDDLRNQRTSVLGAAFGPDDERYRRVSVDPEGHEHLVVPSDGAYQNDAACVGGGTFSYGAMAWRYMEKDFRMRSTYGAVEGSTLADWPLSYARTWNLTTPRRNGKSAFPAMIPTIFSRDRAAGRSHAPAVRQPRAPDP